jgi:TonB family protein
MPHMLAELEDELARSRKREAFWISVVIHIVLALLIIFSPQLLPSWAQPHLLRAEDLANSKEPTFLALPQDMQKPPEKVHTDKLSDKNRIAETPHPQIDRRILEALRAQANQMPPSPPPGMPEPAAPPQPAPPASSQSATNTFTQPTRVQPTEQPQELPTENPFKTPRSVGESIAQAARNTRPRFPGSGGSGGTGYGMGSGDRNARLGPFTILTDTQGVDFGPYLARVQQSIQNNMYVLAPEEVRPPMMKHGRVVIRFLIMADGKVNGMNVESSSGDVPMDRASWGSITASSPFGPLPQEFHGPYIELLFGFYYNPTTQEWEQALSSERR